MTPLILEYVTPVNCPEKSRRNLIILSIVTIVLSCIANQVESAGDLSLIYPLWFLPQKNIFSFLIGYFLTKGIHLTIGILFWMIAYQFICYVVQVKISPYLSEYDELKQDIQKKEEEEKEQLKNIQLQIPRQSKEFNLLSPEAIKKTDNKSLFKQFFSPRSYNILKSRLKKIEPVLKYWRNIETIIMIYFPTIFFLYAATISFTHGVMLIQLSWPF